MSGGGSHELSHQRNRLDLEEVIQPPTTGAGARHRRLLLTAWMGTLLLSSLPQIIVVDVLGLQSPPMTLVWLVGAATLVVIARLWDPARRLGRYFTVMAAVMVLVHVILPWATSFLPGDESSLAQALQHKTIFSLFALVFAGFLLKGLRLTRREALLAPGSMAASSTIRLPGMRRPFRWSVFGIVASILLFAAFGTQMWIESSPGGAETLEQLVPLVPLIILAACFNAFGEEVIFRSGPLATLFRVVGPGHAVMLTSVWFGLGHYFGGIPSGVIGAVQAGVLALLLGTAMLETRGLAWPWIIHFAIDLAVFASIAVTP